MKKEGNIVVEILLILIAVLAGMTVFLMMENATLKGRIIEQQSGEVVRQ